MTKCKKMATDDFTNFYSCCSHYYLLKKLLQTENDPVYDKNHPKGEN